METNTKAGWTLLEIIIVVAIIGMLAIISYPAFVRARQSAQLTSCLDKLRDINGAISQWVMDNGKSSSDPVIKAEIDTYIKRPEIVFSEPTGGSFTLGNVDEGAVCSNYNVADHPATL
jgi:prepilin-type N-terminal cleavage/methylation domain-containing protein